jgi:hypothetical protein
LAPQATIAGQLACTTHIPRAFRDHPYFQRATGEPVGSRPRRCRCRASQCPAPRLGGGIIGIGALPSTTCPQFPGARRRETRKCLQKKGLRGSTTATFGGFACPWRSPRGCLGPSPGPLTPLWRSSRRLVGPGAGFQVHDPCRSRPVPRSEPNVVLPPGHPSSRSQSFSPTPSELVPGLLPAPATTCDSRSPVRGPRAGPCRSALVSRQLAHQGGASLCQGSPSPVCRPPPLREGFHMEGESARACHPSELLPDRSGCPHSAQSASLADSSLLEPCHSNPVFGGCPAHGRLHATSECLRSAEGDRGLI